MMRGSSDVQMRPARLLDKVSQECCTNYGSAVVGRAAIVVNISNIRFDCFFKIIIQWKFSKAVASEFADSQKVLGKLFILGHDGSIKMPQAVLDSTG